MDSELKRNIEQYVTDKYTVEQGKIRAEFQDKMAALPILGRGNRGYSKYADDRHIRLYIEMVNSWAKAMANIRITAYEMYGVPLDSDIISQAKIIRDGGVGALSGSVNHEMQLEHMRHVRHIEHGKAIAANFRRQLEAGTCYIEREVRCLIEERKAVANQKSTSVGAINMNAPGQRVVFGDDHSNNTLTINEQSFFTKAEHIVKAEFPAEKQLEVLDRLAAVEASIHTPDLATRWAEFRAAAADYWSFILPAMPLIQDLLHRHGIFLA
jgi:hypothetical protein